MSRTITVKGIGKISIVPDQIIIEMSLSTSDMDYEKCMQSAANQLDRLRKALSAVGFEKEDLKTTNFDIDTCYKNIRDEYGNYTSIFEGYTCSHNLKLEFDKDMSRLADVLYEISRSSAEPEFSIHFSTNDKEKAAAELLENAVINAKSKAEILTKAAGVVLGDIISIDYNWGELRFNSPTRYESADICCADKRNSGIDIEPDNINASDTVAVVWEIR